MDGSIITRMHSQPHTHTHSQERKPRGSDSDNSFREWGQGSQAAPICCGTCYVILHRMTLAQPVCGIPTHISGRMSHQVWGE